MARLPRRTLKPGRGISKAGGSGLPSMGTHRKPVGYGQHGKKFFSLKKYNQSKSGRAHAAAAKAGHPLSQKPVGYGAQGKAFFSRRKFNIATAMRTKRAGRRRK